MSIFCVFRFSRFPLAKGRTTAKDSFVREEKGTTAEEVRRTLRVLLLSRCFVVFCRTFVVRFHPRASEFSPTGERDFLLLLLLILGGHNTNLLLLLLYARVFVLLRVVLLFSLSFVRRTFFQQGSTGLFTPKKNTNNKRQKVRFEKSPFLTRVAW